MQAKRLLLWLLALGLVLLPIQPLLAWDNTVVFGDSGAYANQINEYSPSRTDDSGTTEDYVNVNSKFNQPRHVGLNESNPHQGVDLDHTSEKVWSVFYGWVTEVTDESSGYLVTIRVDGNLDAVQNDALYVTYRHLSDVQVSVGNSVTPWDYIAKQAYSDHIHFGNRTDLDGAGTKEWVKNEYYYQDNSSSQWSYGWDLDIISDPQYDYRNHIVKAIIYAHDENGYHYISSGDVKLYHRLDGGTTWTGSNMTKIGDMSFQFDLDTVYSLGSTVEWLIRVERTDLRISWPNAYRYAFYPAKYAQPNYVPSSTYPFVSSEIW